MRSGGRSGADRGSQPPSHVPPRPRAPRRRLYGLRAGPRCQSAAPGRAPGSLLGGGDTAPPRPLSAPRRPLPAGPPALAYLRGGGEPGPLPRTAPRPPCGGAVREAGRAPRGERGEGEAEGQLRSPREPPPGPESGREPPPGPPEPRPLGRRAGRATAAPPARPGPAGAPRHLSGSGLGSAVPSTESSRFHPIC